MFFPRPHIILPRVAPIVTATFDPAGNNFQITLSNGSLTATNSVGPAFGNVRGTTSKSTGKFYIEWTMTGTVNSGVFIGLCNGSQSFASGFVSGFTTNSVGLISNRSTGSAGDIILNSSVLVRYTSATIASGDVDGLAVDIGAGLLWARRNAGGWNDDILANQNPATGTGGVDIAGLGTPLFFTGEVETNAATGTVNTGGSAYANSAPAGYGTWT